jgi:hypothetical protein
MADSADPKYLDKRTAERYLRSGQLDEKAYDRHVKSLPDVADKAVPVETHMLDDIDDDFEDDEDDIDEDEDEDASDEGSEDESSEDESSEDESSEDEGSEDEGTASA